MIGWTGIVYRVFLYPALCLTLLAGCAVGPDYIRPSAPDQGEWIHREDSRLKSESTDLSQWWSVFNDAVLNSLVEKAYQQNLTLKIAGIRILEARAQLGIAAGNLYPQSQSARGGYKYTSGSENMANTTPNADFNYGELSVGFDAAWELDFWGKFRRAVESNVGSLDASVAAYDDVLVTLTAEVARVYTVIRTLEVRLLIARENVKIQERSLQIVDAQFRGGAVTELDQVQAKSLLSNTQALIPSLQTSLRQAKNALALLLGVLPNQVEALLRDPRPIPAAPAQVSVGVPAELLRRRPDIRLAERQLAAQSALIGVAKADLYPHFSLFGSIGLRSSDAFITAAGFPLGSSLGDMFDSRSIEFFGGPGFTWDIFNYGRIKNRVRVQDARFQQLALNYQNTVIKAAQEVEDTMVAFLRSQEEVEYLSESVAAAKRSVQLSLTQYREGLVDYQRVLDSQRFLSQQQDTLTSKQGSVATNLISMYKSLGGGWEIRVGKDFVPEEIKKEMENRTDWGDLLTPVNLELPAQEQDRVLWRSPDW